jgi:hypothetical protein
MPGSEGVLHGFDARKMPDPIGQEMPGLGVRPAVLCFFLAPSRPKGTEDELARTSYRSGMSGVAVGLSCGSAPT